MREIYEAIEGPLVLMECLEKGERYCPYCSVGTQISVWDRAQSLLVGYLEGVSIQSIADTEGLKNRLISLLH